MSTTTTAPPKLARHKPIALPEETFPITLSPLLTSLSGWDLRNPYLPTLLQHIFDACATDKPVPCLRIVHISLVQRPIWVYASEPSVGVTFGDILYTLHQFLHQIIPLQPRHSPFNHQAVWFAYTKRCQVYETTTESEPMREVDRLGESPIFMRLYMEVPRANRILGVIDEWQSRTWILETVNSSGEA